MNSLGKVFNQLRIKRQQMRERAEIDLWRRNNLSPEQKGYRIAESRVRLPDGTEFVELRLYQLIDAAVVSLDIELTENIKEGISHLHDFNSDPTHPNYYNK